MKNKSQKRRRRVKKQKPAQKKAQNENFFEAQVQRKCEKCEDEDKKGVQKKSNGQSAAGNKSFFGHYMNNIGSKGAAMSKQNRNFFEGRMNDNFGNVKLHKDVEAANAAKEIGAKAFTWQNHIVVNKQYFEEGSLEAKQLLAHELKHVQQQKNGRHVIQMMPEEESAGPSKEEEGVNPQDKTGDQMANTEAAAMEKEAEREEELVLAPESVPEIQYIGQPTSKTVFGQSISIQGVTNATYDGGEGRSSGLKRTTVTEGPGCAEGDCWHYTGQYTIDYSVSTSISLPDVPSGLSPCQEDRVREAITNELSPHEDQHVTAFEQYNGSVTLPIDYTGPSSGIDGYLQQLHDANEAARRAVANAASAALDPFHVNIDLECEDEPAAAQPPAPGSPPVS